MESASTFADSEQDLPSNVMRKTWVRIVAGIVGALLASGTVMRVGALSPSNLLGMATHTRLLSLHGALTLAALFVLLVHFAPSRRTGNGLRVTLGAVHAIGAAMLSFSGESQSVSLAGHAVCLVAIIVFAVVILEVRSWAGAIFLLATLAQVSAWGGTLLGWPQLSVSPLQPLVLAVLVGPLLAPHSSRRPLLVVGIVTYILTRIGIRFFGLPPLALVDLVAGVSVGVAVFRSAKKEPKAWLMWTRRVEALLFAEAVFLMAFVGLIGNHYFPLHDTLFPVGAAHLEAFVLVFALLRAFLGAGSSWLGWTGFSLAAVGAHVFCWGSVVLGSRGMPRRYGGYLDTFASLQTIISVGAGIMVVGVIASVLACVAARKSTLKTS